MKGDWRRLTIIEEGVTTETNGIFTYSSDAPACMNACPVEYL